MLKIDIDTKRIMSQSRYVNNEIQNIKGNIRVYLRIKPITESKRSILSVSNQTLRVDVPLKHQKSQNSTK